MTNPKDRYTALRIVTCKECNTKSRLDTLATSDSWKWNVVLVERTTRNKRELALPSEKEIVQATQGWLPTKQLSSIPKGRETAVLSRHGFKYWHDLYPSRQRYMLEQLLETIQSSKFTADVSEALRQAALGVAEMAGLASRWDRWYLKSYETMSSHRFNFTTFTAEPNVWGANASGRGTFCRRIKLFEKAALWLEARVGKLSVEYRFSSDRRKLHAKKTNIIVVEGSSERIALPRGSVDLILTDPPYHDDVQYDELSLPLRAWADLPTHTLESEAVAKDTDELAFTNYRNLLTRIFKEASRSLSPTGHFIFSYANREPLAWVAILSALHDAGFKAAGYSIVHSENETDHAKRNVRACTLDLILDMVPFSVEVTQWRPINLPSSAEISFLKLVGETLLKYVGIDGRGWIDKFKASTNTHPFIKKKSH